MDEAEAIEELGLDADELGLDQLAAPRRDRPRGRDDAPRRPPTRRCRRRGTANVIEAHDVVAGYVPEVNILNGCDLTVAPGEFVGIIGPNGAGKSTLLKAVLGLVTVRSGTILLHGDDITGQPAHKLVQRGVGFVPQTQNVFQTLTVRENLEMGCFLAPKRVRRALRGRHRAVPAARPSGPTSGPARCRAASARWWRWAGR